ncbi:hypothetical protein WCX18_07830 [Sulfurimonas sp. HSL1-2]|uniref:hypothetical protein n=1 Tax=Thiomicrolovo zhangzhouensis TaxID=3131933 RepID=UPI0031F93C90
MLSTFNALKAVYASREITMDDLEVLQQYDFIHFENRGISRSETDCLLCEVRCEPFATFLTAITAAVFESAEVLRDMITKTGLGLFEEKSDDVALLSFMSEDKAVEIIASVAPDGSVSIDAGDIEVLPFFQVYLRVQH